jgi:hypothetical protein
MTELKLAAASWLTISFVLFHFFVKRLAQSSENNFSMSSPEIHYQWNIAENSTFGAWIRG